MIFITITMDKWKKEAKKRYGEYENIRFQCPMCGYVATPKDWLSIGAGEGEIGFSCIGRHHDNPVRAFGEKNKHGGPCDYAGGGLLRVNPVHIELIDDEGKKYIRQTFDFADDPLTSMGGQYEKGA